MRKGTRLDGMVNLSELSINFVKLKKPNALTGFDQKGTWLVNPFPRRVTGTTGPPEKRQNRAT
jgi:hypothetical protein